MSESSHFVQMSLYTPSVTRPKHATRVLSISFHSASSSYRFIYLILANVTNHSDPQWPLFWNQKRLSLGEVIGQIQTLAKYLTLIIIMSCCLHGFKVKLATIVESDSNAPFIIATTPKCTGRYYSIPWIAPHYLWFVRYKPVC